MPTGPKRRRLLRSGGAALLSALALVLGPASAAQASGPPIVGAAWTLAVLNESARLDAEINPNGLATAFHFDYITEAAYEANVAQAKAPFTGAAKLPSVNDVNVGGGSSMLTTAPQLLAGLPPSTAYRYRLVAHNSAGTTAGTAHSFATQASGGPLLADSRGWELVSPIDKNGGEVAQPGQIAAGGVLQAASQGGQVTYSSSASFAGGQGAPPASQYIASRNAGGWATQNITAPVFSGSFQLSDEGVPFQLFSGDLSLALLLNGDHCRGEAEGCAVANPPLAGTDAPEGYQDYYRRDNTSGAFTALLGAANAGFLTPEPKTFDLRLAGATPDLGHAVLSSCAALAPNATEVALGEGCDPAQQNLYEWSGAGLSLLNIMPSESQGTPGAALAAQSGAISEDGGRVYFTDSGNLYLREGSTTKEVAPAASFQTATANGATAFYLKADEHLYRYQSAGAGTSTDITPSGEVKGVLGASASGDTVYYQDGSALKRWHSGATTTLAAGAGAALGSDWPPSTGTARVSADGTKLLFLSKAQLTEYDNTDLDTKAADAEVFLYDSGAASPLTCVSCNPTGERPLGPSSVSGAIANGTAPGSTDTYKPRSLSADGGRVFFDSRDALALTDTNLDRASGASVQDAYEWEAQGEGSCAKAGGCVSLLSSGRDAGSSTFIDAAADGADAFFLTAASLIPADPGSVDLYDARAGGGFPEPPPPLPCEGDACQSLPSEPIDPTLDTLLSGPGNPPVRYPGVHCRKGFVKHRGECVKKEKKKHHKKHGHKRRAK
jgi:hypothetical protein